MKTSYRFFATSAALIVAASALMATPAQARHRMKRSHRTGRHAAMRHHTMMHHSAMGSMGTMHRGSAMGKGSMNGGAMGTPVGNANPAMSTAPATSGGDKP